RSRRPTGRRQSRPPRKSASTTPGGGSSGGPRAYRGTERRCRGAEARTAAWGRRHSTRRYSDQAAAQVGAAAAATPGARNPSGPAPAAEPVVPSRARPSRVRSSARRYRRVASQNLQVGPATDLVRGGHREAGAAPSMDGVSPQRADKPVNRQNAPQGGQNSEGGANQPGAPSGQSWRWLWGVLAIGIVAILLAVGTIKTNNAQTLSYTQFMHDVQAKQIATAKISNSSGQINGNFKGENGKSYQVQGPSPSLPNDVQTMRNDGVEVSFPTPSSNLLSDILPYLFIIGIGAAFIYFIGRQTRGQMSGIMSIGRSKAKTFSSDRPSTTFEDV